MPQSRAERPRAAAGPPAGAKHLEGRDAVPSFRDGASAQAVADAVLASDAEGRWVEVSGALD